MNRHVRYTLLHRGRAWVTGVFAFATARRMRDDADRLMGRGHVILAVKVPS